MDSNHYINVQTLTEELYFYIIVAINKYKSRNSLQFCYNFCNITFPHECCITYNQVTLIVNEPKDFTILLQSAASALKLYIGVAILAYNFLAGKLSLYWEIAAI